MKGEVKRVKGEANKAPNAKKRTLEMGAVRTVPAATKSTPSVAKVLLTPAGLERRLKRHLIKAPHEFLAVTTPGMEAALEGEIRALPNVTALRRINGGVEFGGPLETVYHAGLRLRTANRVLMRIDSFVAKSYPELYNKARRIPWELYCGFSKTVGIHATARVSRLHHTENIAQAVFDALSEHMGKLGVKVALDKKSEGPRFAVREADDTCTVSIDASGSFLYKRGYREEIAHAPLRESIAAALLMLVEWQKFPVVADPLCGSGTFLIEAACLARNIAPGLMREFAFSAWPSFNAPVWERAKREAVGAQKAKASVRLLASDISSKAVEAAKGNAGRAGVAEDIVFRSGNCLEFNRDGSEGKTGLIISNLPYGKRAFAGGDLDVFYKRFGEHLHKCCRGWTYGFLVADRSFLQTTKLKAKAELRFENGGLEVFFVTGTID